MSYWYSGQGIEINRTDDLVVIFHVDETGHEHRIPIESQADAEALIGQLTRAIEINIIDVSPED